MSTNRRINDTSRAMGKVDPSDVANALGAEETTPHAHGDRRCGAHGFTALFCARNFMRRAAERAADVLWRHYKAPRHRLCTASRDARRILSAALKGEVLPPTLSETHPWEGYRPMDAAARAKRHEEAMRRGHAAILRSYTTDVLLGEWTWMHEVGGDAAPFWAEIKRRAQDNDHTCQDVVAGVEAGEAEARDNA